MAKEYAGKLQGDAGWYMVATGTRLVVQPYRVMWLHNQSTVDGTLQVDGRTIVGG